MLLEATKGQVDSIAKDFNDLIVSRSEVISDQEMFGRSRADSIPESIGGGLTTGRTEVQMNSIQQSELSLGLDLTPKPKKRVRKMLTEEVDDRIKGEKLEEIYQSAFMTLKEIANIKDNQSINGIKVKP